MSGRIPRDFILGVLRKIDPVNDFNIVPIDIEYYQDGAGQRRARIVKELHSVKCHRVPINERTHVLGTNEPYIYLDQTYPTIFGGKNVLGKVAQRRDAKVSTEYALMCHQRELGKAILASCNSRGWDGAFLVYYISRYTPLVPDDNDYFKDAPGIHGPSKSIEDIYKDYLNAKDRNFSQFPLSQRALKDKENAGKVKSSTSPIDPADILRGSGYDATSRGGISVVGGEYNVELPNLLPPKPPV